MLFLSIYCFFIYLKTSYSCNIASLLIGGAWFCIPNIQDLNVYRRKIRREYTHITGAILLFLTFAYLTNYNNLIIGIFIAGWIFSIPRYNRQINRETPRHRSFHTLVDPFCIVRYLKFNHCNDNRFHFTYSTGSNDHPWLPSIISHIKNRFCLF